MLNKINISILLIILIIPQLLISQSNISLEEAIETAVKNSQELEIAKFDVEKAEADVDEAFGFALPQLNLSANFTHNVKPLQFYIAGGLFPGTGGDEGRFVTASADNQFDSRLELTQTLFNSAVFRSISASDNYADAAKERYDIELNRVVSDVKRAYYSALLQKESYELVKVSKENAEKSFNDIKALFEEGLVSEYDKIRAEVQVENFKPQLVSAENEFTNAKNNLKVIIGIDPSEEIDLANSLEDFNSMYEEQITINEIEGKIIKENPQLKALEVQQEVNKDFIAVNEAEYLPRLSFFGNYAYQGQSNTFDFVTASTSAVGLRFNMNLFSGLQTNAKVEKAELDLKKTETQAQFTKMNLKSQTRNLVNRIRSSKDQLEANKKNISQAKRGYEIAKIRYEEGIGSLLELNDSDLALRTAKMNNLRTKFELLVSYTQLDQLLGNYSDKYGNQ